MVKKQKKIKVEETKIRLYTKEKSDFICITCIAKRVREQTDIVIQAW
jgi:hypothetical protein